MLDPRANKSLDQSSSQEDLDDIVEEDSKNNVINKNKDKDDNEAEEDLEPII